MSDAAPRTTAAVDSGLLVTKASLDAKNDAMKTKTVAAASRQVEECIAFRIKLGRTLLSASRYPWTALSSVFPAKALSLEDSASMYLKL